MYMTLLGLVDSIIELANEFLIPINSLPFYLYPTT